MENTLDVDDNDAEIENDAILEQNINNTSGWYLSLYNLKLGIRMKPNLETLTLLLPATCLFLWHVALI